MKSGRPSWSPINIWYAVGKEQVMIENLRWDGVTIYNMQLK